jgi:carboxyl-terminal processing protease
MNRKSGYLGLGVVLGAAATVAAPQALSYVSPSAYAAAADTYRQLNLFGDVFDKIRNDYVEKPDEAKLIEAAINGMLASLDPHSSYMDAKQFKDMQVQTKGEFGGLGIEVTQEDGLIKVVTPIDDTPAAKAGILSGDVITAIDDTPTQGLTLDQAVEKMRGAINSPVRLKIVRGPKKDVREFTVVRDLIKVQSVRSHVEDGDVGYIRVTQFTEQTADGLKAAMEKLKTEIPSDKLKGYILDLRNNPGGLLDQSIDVVNSFIDRGEIVSTRGRTPDETQRFDARPGGNLSGGKPLVVLINGGSASASEIVAGALQDHKRATLIGTRSFGKGSVQTIMPLGQEGALRLTTARYYTPSGRSIQAKGIEPDYRVLEDVPPDLKGKDDMKGEASLKGHLTNGDEDTSASQAYVPPNEKEDKQLTAAIDLLERGVKPVETAAAKSDTAAKAEAVKTDSANPAAPASPNAAKPN